jgi:hypothetical protein
MRVALVAAFLLVLAAGCGSHGRGAPDVKGDSFPKALARLRASGFLVSVPSFPPLRNHMVEQGRGRLGDYRVVGERTNGSKIVTLTVADTPRTGPLGSIVVLNLHPWRVRVPRLVGLTYRKAFRRSPFRTGLWIRVGRVEPLRPAASADGLDAFVVVSQTPRPGASVPFSGLSHAWYGVRPAASTVVVTLGER